MRAAGSAKAVLFGFSEGAPMSILFTATYPELVTALILGSAAARWFPAPDYPCGEAAVEMYESLRDIAAHDWGRGDSIEWYLPNRAALPSIHVPTLVIHRLSDRITPPFHGRCLAERIAGARYFEQPGDPFAAVRGRRRQRRAVRRDSRLPGGHAAAEKAGS
jgi:pimeloyl-ACP methyl ester carboxylesterase